MNDLEQECFLDLATRLRYLRWSAEVKSERVAKVLGEAADEIDRVHLLYLDLLRCVGNKHPGETRHETAKRYIHAAEQLTAQKSPRS